MIKMEQNIVPLYFEKATYCERCNRYLVEVFDYWNNPMGLKQIAEESFRGKSIPLDHFKRAIYRLRCRGCGATYKIRWFKGCPYPMYNGNDNTTLKIFLQQYSQKD